MSAPPLSVWHHRLLDYYTDQAAVALARAQEAELMGRTVQYLDDGYAALECARLGLTGPPDTPDPPR